jgi:hypothetical protein
MKVQVGMLSTANLDLRSYNKPGALYPLGYLLVSVCEERLVWLVYDMYPWQPNPRDLPLFRVSA